MYYVTCSVCGIKKKTNYQEYQKLVKENKLGLHVCRECKAKK